MRLWRSQGNIDLKRILRPLDARDSLTDRLWQATLNRAGALGDLGPDHRCSACKATPPPYFPLKKSQTLIIRI